MRLSSVAGSWAFGGRKANYILESVHVVYRGIRGAKTVLIPTGVSVRRVCKAWSPYAHSEASGKKTPFYRESPNAFNYIISLID